MNLWKKPLLLVMEKLDAATCVSDRTKLKVHKRENFFGFDFEICTFS
jgi:hypothetical protein